MRADPNAGKCVIVVDETLPSGVMLNTAAILGVSLGATLEQILGPDAMDGSGYKHTGLIRMNLPVLKAKPLELAEIRDGAALNNDLLVIDFCDYAQSARKCEDYLAIMSTVASSDIHYLGIALYGEKRLVAKMTGSLPLAR